jgi:proteasome lid subunit RPN8/RPN11
MDVEVTSMALSRMRAAAAAAHPHEACGLLLGAGRRITEAREAANVHPSPATRFEIDPQALIDAHRAARAGGPQVLGYFHSHPEGAAVPSATDRECAARDGRIWAIVAPKDDEADVTFWEDGETGFAALSFVRIDS